MLNSKYGQQSMSYQKRKKIIRRLDMNIQQILCLEKDNLGRKAMQIGEKA